MFEGSPVSAWDINHVITAELSQVKVIQDLFSSLLISEFHQAADRNSLAPNSAVILRDSSPPCQDYSWFLFTLDCVVFSDLFTWPLMRLWLLDQRLSSQRGRCEGRGSGFKEQHHDLILNSAGDCVQVWVMRAENMTACVQHSWFPPCVVGLEQHAGFPTLIKAGVWCLSLF